jgi:signal peptidase II
MQDPTHDSAATPSVPPATPTWPRGAYLACTLGVVLLDQASKYQVAQRFELHESQVVLAGLLNWTRVHNYGAAFGLLADAELPYQALLFTLVSLMALLALAVYAWRLPAQDRLSRGALALIMGGAAGNLIDRARFGYVLDFIDAYWGTYHWPAFNVADAAITTGVALLLLDMLRAPRADEHPVAREASAPLDPAAER